MPVDFRLGNWLVQPSLGRVSRGNETVHLRAKVMDLLVFFTQHAGQVIPKDTILDGVWGTRNVSESALTSAITELRHALEEKPDRPWLIETVPKRGYRLIASVEAMVGVDTTGTAVTSSADGSSPPSATGTAAVSPAKLLRSALSGGRSWWWVALALTAVTTALLPVARRFAGPATDSTRPSDQTTTSLAVLPLRNLTADAGQDWFAEAMTEELTAALSRVGTFRVISGISARHYKGSNKTAPEIARELGGIDWLVDGSVTRENGRVRISLYVDEVTSNLRVGSASFEQRLGDNLDLLDDVGRRLALQVGATMTTVAPLQSRPRSVKADAYESYLHGLYFRNRQMDGGCIQAEPYLLHSVAIDSTFAPPHAALAYCYGANRLNGNLSVADGLSKGRAAIARAFELDEQLADAHVTLALIQHRTEYDWVGAERSLTRALELNPGHAEALVRYGELLYLTGRIEEGLSTIRRGVALVPFSVDYRVILGYALYNLRRFDDAIGQFQQAEELDASRAYPSWGLALTHALQGRRDQAVAEYVNGMRLMVLPDRAAWATRLLEAAYQHGGWQEFWHKELQLAEEGNRNPGALWKPRFARRHVNFEMARRFVRLGDTEGALAWLERAYTNRESIMVCLNAEPAFDGLRSDTRFQDLVHRLGLKP